MKLFLSVVILLTFFSKECFGHALPDLWRPKPTPTTEISQNQETTVYTENDNPLKHLNIFNISTITDQHISTVSTSTSSEDLSKVCGISRGIGTTGRIVGGKKSEFLRWPWMISLRLSIEDKSYQLCGAALLGRLWAITAAHCVYVWFTLNLTSVLQLGFSDFERSVKEVVIHPGYNWFSSKNDLALLRLHEPLLLDSDVMPVCLPPPQLPDITGRWAVATGWGWLSEKGEDPTSLHEVILPIISNAECKEMYAKAGEEEAISDDFLCAGHSSGGKDTCKGDSGGPMVVRGDGGEWVIVGLTSWGLGCGDPLTPGVYIRISKFTDWINGIVTY